MPDNVRVAVRVRPFNQREIERDAKVCIHMDGDKTIITDPESGRVREFTFDYSYWSHTASPSFVNQERVFTDLGEDCLESAWEGYNCSLFAYGQTGSGKSFSMVGNAAAEEGELLIGAQAGIVPRICRSIFERIGASDDSSVSFKVETSMLEIYNERVRDLFNPTNAPPNGLKVREHPKTGPYVEGMSSLLVDSYEAINRLMEEGTKARTIASTKMNETSSRAHTIFQIILTQTRVDRDLGQATDRVSRINLVDLAGSERAHSTGATGDRLKEGININTSLSALGNCINALAERAKPKAERRQKVHVPYRNSVLTWLLKDSLGGNARTVMIAALSPADINHEETLSTLQYANRAKQIQNIAVVNEDQNEKMVRELREEVAALRAQLSGQAQQQRDEEAEAARIKLEEELAESQQIIKQLEMTWAEKEKATEAIEQERSKALEAMGVVVDVSLQGLPQLVNLNEDASLSGCLVYFLRQGDTLVGKALVSGGGQKNAGGTEIRLQGLGIATEHCRLSHTAGENGAVVTLHPNGGVAAKTFVNGKQAPGDGVVLKHGDRVIFGSSNFFKFTDPAEALRIRAERESAEASGAGIGDEPSAMSAIDWEFAQNERLQEAMASSLEDSNAAKAALQKAQSDFAEQEARLAAEKAEAESKLVEQQAQFEAQIAQQEGDRGATAAALEDAQAQLEEQRVAFEKELVAKEAALDIKRQELHREQVRERQQALLEDKLHQLIPLVEEANLLGTELRRHTSFEVKVVSDYQAARATVDGMEKSEPRTVAKVKLTYLAQDRSCLWDQDKFSNRIYLMRELYARVMDDASCLADVTPETDPFYDPPESQLIGVAHIYLEPLAYQLDIRQRTPIVDYQGNTVGSLAVELVPCTPDGSTEGLELVDSPEELVDRRMDLLICVTDATGLDKRYAGEGSFVCHKFYLDDEPTRTSTAAPGTGPVYSFQRHVTVDPMTERYVQYIQEASMTFEVWSQPSDGDAEQIEGAGAEEAVSVAASEPPDVVPSLPLGEPTAEPESELESAAAAEAAAVAAASVEQSLRCELEALKLSELKKRAHAAGVAAADVDQIDDADDPKSAAIALIIAAAAQNALETPREVRLERRVAKAEDKVAELEEALAREKAASSEAKKALAEAETRLTEQKSGSCVVC